jgi:hypothetical protein
MKSPQFRCWASSSWLFKSWEGARWRFTALLSMVVGRGCRRVLYCLVRWPERPWTVININAQIRDASKSWLKSKWSHSQGHVRYGLMNQAGTQDEAKWTSNDLWNPQGQRIGLWSIFPYMLNLSHENSFQVRLRNCFLILKRSKCSKLSIPSRSSGSYKLCIQRRHP